MKTLFTGKEWDEIRTDKSIDTSRIIGEHMISIIDLLKPKEINDNALNEMIERIKQLEAERTELTHALNIAIEHFNMFNKLLEKTSGKI